MKSTLFSRRWLFLLASATFVGAIALEANSLLTGRSNDWWPIVSSVGVTLIFLEPRGLSVEGH